MKKLLAAALSLALCACTTVGTSPPQAPPAVEQVAVETLDTVVDAFDLALTLVDIGISSGTLKPGSSTSLQIEKSIGRVQAAITTANSLRKAVNSPDYAAAIADINRGLACIKEAVKGKVTEQCST